MTLRKNPFVRTKQFYYDDGLDVHWWIDEEDLEWFLSQFSELEVELKDERTLNGKEYNEWMIGNTFGDDEGVYVDEDCPECGHLLVQPECSSITDHVFNDERHCSNFDCDYENEAHINYRKTEDDYWTNLRNQPEPPKFREVGQTLEQFVEKYGFKLEEERHCITCKRTVPVSDFYVSFGYAIVCYAHDDCSNGGPYIAIPQGRKAEEWSVILGK